MDGWMGGWVGLYAPCTELSFIHLENATLMAKYVILS